MLKEIKVQTQSKFKKEVLFEEPQRLNKSAEKKEKITSKYSEAFQLNLLRKAVLGDAQAKQTLQEIEDFITIL